MKKGIFLAMVLASLAYQGWSQQVYSHHISSAPETARYEIVQSEFGARTTLKIDKYTGDIYLLVLTKKEKLTWELMHTDVHFQDITIPDQVNYQIFISGLGPRSTFLMNVNTGATWQLTEDKETEILFWSVLK